MMGSWDAVGFVFAFLAISIAAFAFGRVFFRGKTAKSGGAAEPFLSGNPVPKGFHLHASGLYWGFFTALEGYYKRVVPEHTGNVNDYVAWMVAATAVAMIVFAGGALL